MSESHPPDYTGSVSDFLQAWTGRQMESAKTLKEQEAFLELATWARERVESLLSAAAGPAVPSSACFNDFQRGFEARAAELSLEAFLPELRRELLNVRAALFGGLMSLDEMAPLEFPPNPESFPPTPVFENQLPPLPRFEELEVPVIAELDLMAGDQILISYDDGKTWEPACDPIDGSDQGKKLWTFAVPVPSLMRLKVLDPSGRESEATEARNVMLPAPQLLTPKPIQAIRGTSGVQVSFRLHPAAAWVRLPDQKTFDRHHLERLGLLRGDVLTLHHDGREDFRITPLGLAGELQVEGEPSEIVEIQEAVLSFEDCVFEASAEGARGNNEKAVILLKRAIGLAKNVSDFMQVFQILFGILKNHPDVPESAFLFEMAAKVLEQAEDLNSCKDLLDVLTDPGVSIPGKEPALKAIAIKLMDLEKNEFWALRRLFRFFLEKNQPALIPLVVQRLIETQESAYRLLEIAYDCLSNEAGASFAKTAIEKAAEKGDSYKILAQVARAAAQLNFRQAAILAYRRGAEFINPNITKAAPDYFDNNGYFSDFRQIAELLLDLGGDEEALQVKARMAKLFPGPSDSFRSLTLQIESKDGMVAIPKGKRSALIRGTIPFVENQRPAKVLVQEPGQSKSEELASYTAGDLEFSFKAAEPGDYQIMVIYFSTNTGQNSGVAKASLRVVQESDLPPVAPPRILAQPRLGVPGWMKETVLDVRLDETLAQGPASALEYSVDGGVTWETLSGFSGEEKKVSFKVPAKSQVLCRAKDATGRVSEESSLVQVLHAKQTPAGNEKPGLPKVYINGVPVEPGATVIIPKGQGTIEVVVEPILYDRAVFREILYKPKKDSYWYGIDVGRGRFSGGMVTLNLGFQIGTEYSINAWYDGASQTSEDFQFTLVHEQ